MPTIFSLHFCLLAIGSFLVTLRFSVLSINQLNERHQDCPKTLGEYILLDDYSGCLIPRSDHAAPGLAINNAPEGICYLASRSGLKMGLRFTPYRNDDKKGLKCPDS